MFLYCVYTWLFECIQCRLTGAGHITTLQPQEGEDPYQLEQSIPLNNAAIICDSILAIFAHHARGPVMNGLKAVNMSLSFLANVSLNVRVPCQWIPIQCEVRFGYSLSRRRNVRKICYQCAVRPMKARVVNRRENVRSS